MEDKEKTPKEDKEQNKKDNPPEDIVININTIKTKIDSSLK